MNSSTQNKIKGLFFGQAIGDALGLATEFLTSDQVKEYYPDGIHTYQDIIQDEHRVRWQKGDWTDDTDQFICIAESFIEQQGEIDINDIAGKFYQWMENGGMGIGNNTHNVLSMPEYVEEPHLAADIVWQMSAKKSAPNGALMRNAIVCLTTIGDLGKTLENCEAIAKVTHADPRCIDSCKIMAQVVLGDLNQNPIPFDGLSDIIKQYDQRISAYLFPFHDTIEEWHLYNPKDLGYTLKCLSAGLWGYYYGNTFEDGLMSVIMQGGDADTNGAVAGSLLGLKYGYDAIPKKWIDGLNQKDALNDMYTRFMDQMSVA